MKRPNSMQLDPNYDGLLTISDLWIWFHFPGNFIIHFGQGGWIGTFLELSPELYGGWISLIVSIVVWVYVFRIILHVIIFIESFLKSGR